MATAPNSRSFVPRLFRNPVSLIGGWITTLGVFAFAIYLALEQFGLLVSPYSGLFGFVVVPLLVLLGLLLIPIGIWTERWRRRHGRPAWRWPIIDLDNTRTLTVLFVMAGLTLVNLSIMAVAAVGVVEYSESNAFCGQVCHVPMEPEFQSLENSPHARTHFQRRVGRITGGVSSVRLGLHSQILSTEFAFCCTPLHLEIFHHIA